MLYGAAACSKRGAARWVPRHLRGVLDGGLHSCCRSLRAPGSLHIVLGKFWAGPATAGLRGLPVTNLVHAADLLRGCRAGAWRRRRGRAIGQPSPAGSWPRREARDIAAAEAAFAAPVSSASRGVGTSLSRAERGHARGHEDGGGPSHCSGAVASQA